MNNDWAHDVLTLACNPTFYGELTFTINAGEVKKVARMETFISPRIKEQWLNRQGEVGRGQVRNGLELNGTAGLDKSG